MLLDSTWSSLNNSQLCSRRSHLVLSLQHLVPFLSIHTVLSQISLENKLKRTVHGKCIYTRSRPVVLSLFQWMESPVSFGTQLRSPVTDATMSRILKGFTPAVRHPFSSIIFSSMETLLREFKSMLKAPMEQNLLPIFGFLLLLLREGCVICIPGPTVLKSLRYRNLCQAC